MTSFQILIIALIVIALIGCIALLYGSHAKQRKEQWKPEPTKRRASVMVYDGPVDQVMIYAMEEIAPYGRNCTAALIIFELIKAGALAYNAHPRRYSHQHLAFYGWIKLTDLNVDLPNHLRFPLNQLKNMPEKGESAYAVVKRLEAVYGVRCEGYLDRFIYPILLHKGLIREACWVHVTGNQTYEGFALTQTGKAMLDATENDEEINAIADDPRMKSFISDMVAIMVIAT